MPALGKKSIGFMQRVHPDLQRIIIRAIEITKQDFGLTEEQVRTLEYQKSLVARGVSKTLKSNHLEQVDLTGKTNAKYGHAVDLVPWDGKKFVWDWKLIYAIAAAMAQAAHELGLLDKLCWGGVWDQYMSEYASVFTADEMKKACEAYCVRHAGKDFIDGPHFQIYKRG